MVTATGSIIGEGIIKCLKLANTVGKEYSYEIISADMRADAAGLYRGHHGVLIPSPHDGSKYYDSLASVCRKFSVRAIFPGSDEELFPLAKFATSIEKETGSKVIINPLSALEIAVDKWKTYELLKARNIDCAESCLPENFGGFVEKFDYPFIVKPRTGHGSQGIHLANDETEINLALKKIRESGDAPIIQEYLSGEEAEYTTGIVVGNNMKDVLSSISMRRILKHGQTYKAFVEDAEQVRRSSERVAIELGGRGPVNVQSRLVDDVSKVFEINPRFSASCPIRAVAGINEPDIVFRDQVLGEKVAPPEYRKLVGMRYWSEIYVPLETFETAKQSGRVGVEHSLLPDYF